MSDINSGEEIAKSFSLRRKCKIIPANDPSALHLPFFGLSFPSTFACGLFTAMRSAFIMSQDNFLDVSFLKMQRVRLRPARNGRTPILIVPVSVKASGSDLQKVKFAKSSDPSNSAVSPFHPQGSIPSHRPFMNEGHTQYKEGQLSVGMKIWFLIQR